MKRRNFLQKSIGGTAMLALASPAVAQATGPLRILGADMPATGGLMQRISNVTSGAMALIAEPVEVADAPAMLARVANGEADMCVTPLRHLMGQNLALGMFDSMPFGMGSGELDGWVTASDGRDMMQMLGDEFGVSFHYVADHGTMPMWSRAPISDTPTLASQKIGSRGLGMRALLAMGATSVSDLDDPAIDWSDLDVLDGVSVTEMGERDLTSTFSHMTRVNPNTPTSFSVLAISTAKAASLSDAQHMVLERACSAELAISRARAFHANATALLNRSGEITRFDLPDDVWTTMNGAAQQVLGQIFESGRIQGAIVDAYVYFLTDIARWSEIGEAAYFAGRKRLIAL